MNFRKNSVLIIGCGSALILLILALVFLIKTQNTYRNYTSELSASKIRLQSLNTRDPFPSSENVLRAQENLTVLKQKYDEVRQSLIRDQIVQQSVEPARFAPLLEQSTRKVFAKAAEVGVSLANDLNLGFKDYAAGKLPPADPETMKRLVLQLKAVEDLCLVMIESKVQSIDVLARDVFESDKVTEPTATTGRNRRRSAARSPETVKQKMILGLPEISSNKLYSTERFKIEFTGWESSVRDVLNALASRDISYVIVDLSFENTNQDVGKPVDMKAKLNELTTSIRNQTATGVGQSRVSVQTPSLESIGHEDRIVGGREPIKTKIILDMYQFSDAADEETQL